MWDLIRCIRRPTRRIRSGRIFTPASATNISRSNIQYGEVSADARIEDKRLRWQVANAQPAGTSETSQVATDHINNPNVINNIAI